jgi:hypothetical protein
VSSDAWSTTRVARLDMTSVADGRTHSITGAEFDDGVWRGTGRFRAICGADVLASSMASAPGPRCPICREDHHDDRPVPSAGWLARLRRVVQRAHNSQVVHDPERA